MEYVNLGRSGMKVSRLCLGMMTYGSTQWRPWVLEEEASRPFIRRAWEAGINFFDTADIYSKGVSEEILGRTLRELAIPREQVVVATKVCQPMGGTPNERTPEFLAQWRAGLTQLAQRPNLVCKVSGFALGDKEWTVESLTPVVNACIDIFAFAFLDDLQGIVALIARHILIAVDHHFGRVDLMRGQHPRIGLLT